MLKTFSLNPWGYTAAFQKHTYTRLLTFRLLIRDGKSPVRGKGWMVS